MWTSFCCDTFVTYWVTALFIFECIYYCPIYKSIQGKGVLEKRLNVWVTLYWLALESQLCQFITVRPHILYSKKTEISCVQSVGLWVSATNSRTANILHDCCGSGSPKAAHHDCSWHCFTVKTCFHFQLVLALALSGNQTVMLSLCAWRKRSVDNRRLWRTSVCGGEVGCVLWISVYM